jgi:predicted dehydrogenase
MSQTPKPLRVAVIGLGRAGTVHVRSLDRIAKMTGLVEIVYIADSDISKAELFEKDFGIPKSKFVADYTPLLDDPNIDAIVSCAATSHHFPVNFKALTNNKHLFAEKPGALKLPEMKQLLDLST